MKIFSGIPTESTPYLLMNVLYERMLYAVRCLKSNEDMILALAGQFKQLSHEPEKNVLIIRQLKHPRRRWRQECHKFAYFSTKKTSFARFA